MFASLFAFGTGAERDGKSFDRVKADGNRRVAQGVLALDMGHNPNVRLALVAPGEHAKPDTGPDARLDALIEEARRLHPNSVQARAQLQAALARVETARSQGQPSLSSRQGPEWPVGGLFSFTEIAVLEDPKAFDAMRTKARRTVIDQFDLRRVCLPAQLLLMNRIVGSRNR